MKQLRPLLMNAALVSAITLSVVELSSAELYQEGFNTDGSVGANPRYTFAPALEVYEVPRIQTEIGNYDQKGPIYWAHNFNVSYVGNPTIPARRAIFTWKPAVGGAGDATENLLQVWDSMVAWLVASKPNATVVVYPDTTAIGELADRLTAKGYNVVSDDPGILDEQDVPGDLFIHAATANPSRFAMLPKPVIVMSEPDYDDMLVGSIGSLVSFDPGIITISAATHPAAGGKTGTFTGFNTGPLNFGLVGSFLPPGATTVATVTRTIPPAINNLSDVDAVIAGTKQNSSTEGTVSDVDFMDGASPGNWFSNNPIPGDYAGNWGLRVRGTLNITAADTYRFAVGSDDGVRLYVDLDRNGITASDLVLEDTGPHAHQIVYTNLTFASATTYPFEVRSYNSAGAGSLEVSVSTVPVPVPDDTLENGYYEVLSENGAGPVRMQGSATVTAYVATGANVQEQTPLIVVLNGPNDTPPGSFYDGGQFSGQEGTGFIGASGLNKWTPPAEGYRAVRLKPVDVTGKSDVKLSIKLAGTVVDFETSDLLDVVVYTNGPASNPTTLAHFRGVQNAVQPWLADEKANFVRRLTRQFADFTYDIPPGATQLIVEIRVWTTWWTEIAAFDDIRITSGAIAGDPTLSIERQGADLVLRFSNGTLERATTLGATPAQTTWEPVVATGTHTIAPASQGAHAFFRVRR